MAETTTRAGDQAFHQDALRRLEGEGGRATPKRKGFDVRAEEKTPETALAPWPRNECLRLMDQTPIERVVADRSYITTKPYRDFIGAQVITVDAQDSLQHVVQTMTKHRISCVPVIAASTDEESPGVFLGFVDYLDLATYLASSGPSDASLEAGSQQQEAIARTIASCTAQQLVDKSHKDPSLPMFQENPLTGAVEVMAMGVHRVPLFNNKKRIVGLCSQFDVVQFLAKEFTAGRACGMAARTMATYGEAIKQTWGAQAGAVLSVHPSATVYFAVAKMAMTGAKVLAVVDPKKGTLLGSFSAQDIGAAFYGHQDPSAISSWFALTVKDFLEAYNQEIMTPLFETTALSLGEACKMMADSHAHSIWMVDDLTTMVPVGLVTLTDICRIVTQFQWPGFREREPVLPALGTEAGAKKAARGVAARGVAA